MNKLLIKFPIRNRILQFFRTLNQYYELQSGNNEVHFMINMDIDDPIFNNETVRKRLSQYKNLTYYYQDNKNKVEAINSNLFEMESIDFEVLLLASDDMIPIVKGYDDLILDEMEKTFPDTDGVLWFFDGHNRTINTLCILGKKYFERFGYIYHPSYKSLWCDNEFMEVSKILNKQKFIDTCIIEHQHPDYNGYKYDDLMKKNQSYTFSDYRNFEDRKSKGFENIKISILICTLEKRKAMLDGLIEVLKKQILEAKQLSSFKEVEVLVSYENEKVKLGKKRNGLLEKAKGRFVSFIDDDDEISPNYIHLVLKAITYDPDCCSLNGIITTDGQNPKVFKHSISYDGWYEKDGIYYRTPNHWNTIRKSIANCVRFKDDLSFGEDKDFSQRLRPFLSKEKTIEETIYFFKFRNIPKEYLGQ